MSLHLSAFTLCSTFTLILDFLWDSDLSPLLFRNSCIDFVVEVQLIITHLSCQNSFSLFRLFPGQSYSVHLFCICKVFF